MRIVQAIILHFFLFSVIQETSAVIGGMAGVMTLLIIIVIILGTLLFRIKKGSIYTPFHVTYKDTLFLSFRSYVINVAYCSDS